MHRTGTLAELFEEKPAQWSLRGDPHLWHEMQAALSATPYPENEEQLAMLLQQTFESLTGVSLTERDPIFIERLSHGGMTSGYVSPQFWAEKVVPLLRARYRANCKD